MALKRRTKISASFSMSSMTDIVFLLLIFFMITSTMVHPNAIKLLIPKQATKKVVIDKFINARVSSAGNFTIDNQRVSDAQLENALLKKYNSSDKTFIKLRTNKNAPTGAVAKILDIAETHQIKVVLDIR
ncbi:outer membrane transport energization protein ExbD [Saccharicrinis carchari]|uniref:Outer membrane transport energization protein ExbD n=1 Tax=Saccharicrinis carchari TaxID=1168039 RepID=A0A521DZH6_SACCC|nr:biopolymer transporter ExbD [Saccharicrinis carchari]SMO77129.1 outer membrane transport energization protein ExbD [Saccharicrinis carchari]